MVLVWETYIYHAYDINMYISFNYFKHYLILVHIFTPLSILSYYAL